MGGRGIRKPLGSGFEQRDPTSRGPDDSRGLCPDAKLHPCVNPLGQRAVERTAERRKGRNNLDRPDCKHSGRSPHRRIGPEIPLRNLAGALPALSTTSSILRETCWTRSASCTLVRDVNGAEWCQVNTSEHRATLF
ncbi:hypothetical protein NDU88_004276 [Pleurodeles waltl]|uniref:Uncharacterized protein n=1 Tax=Pleurodeles waltl TaxID=8319 RepID=A0AAV7PFJ5_PLEWA|nr:hypothetical protein NDU88_004276 [Pleurodeles waltl]